MIEKPGYISTAERQAGLIKMSQEEFRACADISVSSLDGYQDNTPNTDTDTDTGGWLIQNDDAWTDADTEGWIEDDDDWTDTSSASAFTFSLILILILITILLSLI